MADGSETVEAEVKNNTAEAPAAPEKSAESKKKDALHERDTATVEFTTKEGEHKIEVSHAVNQAGNNDYVITDVATHTLSGKKMSSQTQEISNQHYDGDRYQASHSVSQNNKQYDNKGNTIAQQEITHEYKVRQSAAEIKNGESPGIVTDTTNEVDVTMDKKNRLRTMEVHQTIDTRSEVQRMDTVNSYDNKENVKSSIRVDYQMKQLTVNHLEDSKNKKFTAQYDSKGAESFTYTKGDKHTVYQKNVDGQVEGYKFTKVGNQVSNYSEMERKDAEKGIKKARQEADELIAKVSNANSADTYKALPGPTNFAKAVSVDGIFKRQTEQQKIEHEEGVKDVQQKFDRDRQLTAQDIAMQKMKEAKSM